MDPNQTNSGRSLEGRPKPGLDPTIPLISLIALLGYESIIWSWPNLSSTLFSKILLEAAWEWEMVGQSPTPPSTEGQGRETPHL